MKTITTIDTKNGLLNIIEELEYVCKRPAMYVCKKDDVDGVVSFLQGFLTACHALGFGYSSDISRQVRIEGNWETGAEGVWLQMRQKGMSEEAIVHELLRMEIRTWQKMVAILITSEELS